MILIAFGTRPEIIKLSPVIKELQKRGLGYKTVFTGQHDELYEDVKDLIPEPDYHLALMEADQTPARVLEKLSGVLPKVLEENQPGLLIVQGDTTTAAACALLAYYHKVPVGHVEAGLRTYDLTSPFPEEGNRQLITRLASFNWAPTRRAVENLQAEKAANIILTGNTVVYACLTYNFPVTYGDKVLVTLHRRENFGARMEHLFRQLEELAEKHPDLQFIFPMHPNPNVQRLRPLLRRVKVIEPLGYPQMLRLLSEVRFVITDSGGLQEECAAFRKKVLVCRDTTERPEGIEAGFARLVGTALVENFAWANENPYWNGENPYGDGQAAVRIVESIARLVDT